MAAGQSKIALIVEIQAKQLEVLADIAAKIDSLTSSANKTVTGFGAAATAGTQLNQVLDQTGKVAPAAAAGMNETGSVAEKVAAFLDRLAESQRKANEEQKKTPPEVDKAKTAFGGLNNVLGVTQQLLGVGLSIGGVFAVVDGAARMVRAIAQIGDEMGVGVERASKYAFGIMRTGREYESLRMAALLANTSLQAVMDTGDKAKVSAFATLGLDVAKIQNIGDLIDQITDAYHRQIIENGKLVTNLEKEQAIRVILGRSAFQILPFIEQYNSKTAEQTKLTEEQIEASNRFLEKIVSLQLQLKLGIGLPIVEFANAHFQELELIAGTTLLVFGMSKLLSVAVAVLPVIGKLAGEMYALGAGGSVAAAGEAEAAVGIEATGIAAGAAMLTLGLYLALFAAAAWGVEKIYEAVKAWFDLRDAENQATQAETEYNKALAATQAQAGKPIARTASQVEGLDRKAALDALLQWQVARAAIEEERDKLKAEIDDYGGEVGDRGYKLLQSKLAAIKEQITKANAEMDLLRGRLHETAPKPATPEDSGTAAAVIPLSAKQVAEKWAGILAVEKAAMDLREAQRVDAEKTGKLREEDALQQRIQDEVAYNAKEIEATKAEIAAVIAERQKLGGIGLKAGNKAFDDSVAAEQKLQAKLQVLQENADKITVEGQTKTFELQQAHSNLLTSEADKDIKTRIDIEKNGYTASEQLDSEHYKQKLLGLKDNLTAQIALIVQYANDRLEKEQASVTKLQMLYGASGLQAQAQLRQFLEERGAILSQQQVTDVARVADFATLYAQAQQANPDFFLNDADYKSAQEKFHTLQSDLAQLALLKDKVAKIGIKVDIQVEGDIKSATDKFVKDLETETSRKLQDLKVQAGTGGLSKEDALIGEMNLKLAEQNTLLDELQRRQSLTFAAGSTEAKANAASIEFLRQKIAALAPTLREEAAISDNWILGFRSGIKNFQDNFGTLATQVADFTDRTMQRLSDTTAKVMFDMETRTRKSGQAWREMGAAVVQALNQMLSTYIASKLAMMAVDAAYGAAQKSQNASSLASGAAGGLGQAASQGGIWGVLLYVAVFAAAMAAIMAIVGAISGGFAEGGLVGERSGVKMGGGSGATEDNHLIRVSEKEAVISGKSVDKYGAGFIQKIIDGTLEVGKFALGGFVEPDVALAGISLPITSPFSGGRGAGASINLRPSINITNNHYFGDEEIDRFHATSASKRNVSQQIHDSAVQIARNVRRKGGNRTDA